MKKIKIVLETISLGLLAASVIYGAIGFQQLSLNPFKWITDARAIFSTFGGMAVLSSLIIGILRSQE